MNDKTIVFIAGTLGIGGAEKQLFLACKGLLADGWNVKILTLSPEKYEYWEKPLSTMCVEIIPIHNRSILKRILEINEILRKTNPRIIHGWHFYTNFYSNVCGFLSRVKLRIGSVQEDPGFWSESYLARIVCLYGLNKIMVNSEKAATEIQEKYLNILLPKMYLIRNGIEKKEIGINKKINKQELSWKWSIDPNVPWICALGRQDLNKNWINLLDAANLASKNLKFHIIFLGNGPEHHNLQQYAEKLGINKNVSFLGFFPEAEKILQNFDILVLTSRSEGLPNVLLEAGQIGLPVIASNVGGIPEYIEDKKNGFLINPDDYHLLAVYIELLLTNKKIAERLGGALRRKTKKEYSYHRFIKRLNEMYLEKSNSW